MTAPTRGRVALEFDGELDAVPAGAATALSHMARALLQHGDEHDGAPATIRMGLVGSLLNLWLTDPECSPACLCGSGHLPGTADQDDTVPSGVRLVLGPGPDGGLRLHWTLVLAKEPAAPHLVPSQRWGSDAPDLEGTQRRTGERADKWSQR